MQAPIWLASTPELVTAVAGMGALGTLAASWTEPELLRRQIRRLRSELETPFCVNLVLSFDQRERLRVSLEEGVSLVSFSWGSTKS
jgi:nitronate monooxygenase